MKNDKAEKGTSFIVAELLDYFPRSVVIKTIIHKTTGSISIASFDRGEVSAVKVSAFDTLIQVVEGEAEVIINTHSQQLATGEAIIIPAHSRNQIKANVRFKIISTLIKSGYEEYA